MTKRLLKIFVLACITAAVLISPAAATDEEHLEREKQLRKLVDSNTHFAVELYGGLHSEEGNLFFSPFSILNALAMTWAGARGETAAQMAEALRFSPEQKDIHTAFADLMDGLKTTLTAEEEEDAILTLQIANALWPQKGYPFCKEYLDLLRTHYSADTNAADYRKDPESARKEINAWVEDATRGKIRDLIPPGALSELTRLVLVNAVYFKGDWLHPFNTDATREAPFFTPDGSVKHVPLMNQKRNFAYIKTDGIQIVELPYADEDLSMIILLPEEKGTLNLIEKRLVEEPGLLHRWTQRLHRREVDLYLPRFEIEWGSKSLIDELKSLGMLDAFDPSAADFSGMTENDPESDLHVSDVVHKAFVSVNEEGTEAAAATGIIVGVTSLPPPPVVFRADHPFLFLIRQNSTGSVLFMGRLSDVGS